MSVEERMTSENQNNLKQNMKLLLMGNEKLMRMLENLDSIEIKVSRYFFHILRRDILCGVDGKIAILFWSVDILRLSNKGSLR